MDGFTYTNIFDTKGIEYLFVVVFFAMLIPFWLLLNRRGKQMGTVQKAAGFITAGNLRIPQGLFFSKYHTWAFLEATGQAKVGLDDLLLQLTGEVAVSHLKKAGEYVGAGQLLTVIDHDGKSLRILSPVSGKVVASNDDLLSEPGILRTDPYRRGWVYRIQPTNWKADTGNCFLAEDASQWAVAELERFKDFLAVAVNRYLPQPTSVVLQDGGELLDHPLAELPQEVWKDFQQDFLE